MPRSARPEPLVLTVGHSTRTIKEFIHLTSIRMPKGIASL
jgi:hypothetical protein